MRTFSDLDVAISEIQRDLSRADKVYSSRVQHQTGLNLEARELINYSYQILGGIPLHASQLVQVGLDKFPDFFKKANSLQWETWLESELNLRLSTGRYVSTVEPAPEAGHPALSTAKEGNWYGYTYAEIMFGAYETLFSQLKKNPDTRRAYFPFFEKHHAHRAAFPTRVPCSIGYQVMIREQPGFGPMLNLIYLQRSSDFDRFWLTDVWFARMFQHQLMLSLNEDKSFKFYGQMKLGSFMHTIMSLHSFVGGEEIY